MRFGVLSRSLVTSLEPSSLGGIEGREVGAITRETVGRGVMRAQDPNVIRSGSGAVGPQDGRNCGRGGKGPPRSVPREKLRAENTCPVTRQMGKPHVVCTNNGISFHLEMERNSDARGTMDELEDVLLVISWCAESTGGSCRGPRGSVLGHSFSLGTRILLQMGGGDGCTAVRMY